MTSKRPNDEDVRNAGIGIGLPGSELEKEAAKIAGHMLGRAADGVMDIGGNIVGGLIGDRIREWRTRNLVDQLAETARRLKEKGVDLEKARSLPLGETYAIFEEASKQDDLEVQALWSGLLANAMDPSSEVSIDAPFVASLCGFGRAEAMVLRFVGYYWRERAAAHRRLLEIPNRLRNSNDDGDWSEFVKREVANNKTLARFNSDVVSKWKREFTQIDDERIAAAVGVLLKERCICVPATERYWTHLIEAREEDVHRERFSVVDGDRLIDVLNEVNLLVRSAIDYPGSAPPLIRDIKLFDSNAYQIGPSYELTSYGSQLLLACGEED